MFTNYIPTKLLFGNGSLDELSNCIEKYGRKVLFLGPYMNDAIRPMFDRAIKIMDEAGIRHIDFFEIEANPSTTTTDKAFALAKENKVDCIVAMGGGSVMDVSKIIRTFIDEKELKWNEIYGKYTDYRIDYASVSEKVLPLITVATTAGTGSENTQASVITNAETHEKLTVFHPDGFPDVAIMDPELHMTMPGFITASTAFDAFTHAFESYLNNNDNPIIEMYQLSAIKNIVEYLPKVLKDNKIEYREKIALAATMAGSSLANTGACLPHPLSEIIGSDVTGLAHGQALAMVYPAFVKYTAEKYQSKYAEVCRIFDSNYNDVNDEVTATCFNAVLSEFLENNGLTFRIRDYADEDMIEKVRTKEVWNHLPMEETTAIREIVDEICKY